MTAEAQDCGHELRRQVNLPVLFVLMTCRLRDLMLGEEEEEDYDIK
jgi:hypothetical protein